MDDVDGALFSRLPVGESGNDLESLPDVCRYEDKYSKLDNSDNLSRKEGNDNRNGKDHSGDIIKRETVQVFRSIPPNNKVDRKDIDQIKLSEITSRLSAPCELYIEGQDEPTDTCTPPLRTGIVKLSRKQPLLIVEKDQQSVSKVRPSSQEFRKGISDKITVPESNPEGSCSSFGDIDSNWDAENIAKFDAESFTEIELKPDTGRPLKTELVFAREKGLVNGSNDTPSRPSSMFYVNEDEQFIDTNERDTKTKSEAAMDKVSVANTKQDPNLIKSATGDNEKTEGVDSIDAKCPHISEPTRFEHNTQLINADVPEKEIMLKDNVDKKRRTPVFCRVILALTFPVLSLIIYVWDIGSDIRLAVAYKDQGDMNLFWITTACIVIPLILMSIVDVSWLWLDRPPSRPSHLVRYILGVVTLGRIVRSVMYMWHIAKSKTLPKEEGRTWHKNRATEAKRDCYMLDFINAFLESVPQLFVQLYLMYAFDLELTTIRILNLLSSWASIAWAYSAYYKCNRETRTGKQEINGIGFTVFLMSVLSALAARVICVVLFLVYFETWIGSIVLTVHFILTLFWIIYRENPKLEGTTPWKLGKYLYCVFFAYVSLLCFLNLRNSKARFRMVAFYFLMYAENFTMGAFSFYKMYVSATGKDKLYNLLALPLGFILHITLLVTYYKIFHPKTGMCKGYFKRAEQSI